MANGVAVSDASSPKIDWMLLLVKARRLDAMLEKELLSYELSLGEYEMLSALRNGPLPQSAICEFTRQSIPSISRGLKRFEVMDWVMRDSVTRDRRRLQVTLTHCGALYLETADRGIRRAVTAFLESLEPLEAQTLSNLYRRVEN